MTRHPTVELHRARPDDLEAAGEVTVAAYAPFTEGEKDFYLAELRDTPRRAREADLWVAVEGDRVVGTVTICPDGSPWREIATDEEGELRMLAVAPEAQGRGVGAALMGVVLRELAGRPIVLSSLAEMAAAHRLYRRLGFERLPERDWSPAPGVDLVAFRRPADA